MFSQLRAELSLQRELPDDVGEGLISLDDGHFWRAFGPHRGSWSRRHLDLGFKVYHNFGIWMGDSHEGHVVEIETTRNWCFASATR